MILPKQDDYKATNLGTRNKQSGSKSINHESQTMTFCTRASKHVFPKRSPKKIDGTEIPKYVKPRAIIPLWLLAKGIARYNEFPHKLNMKKKN